MLLSFFILFFKARERSLKQICNFFNVGFGEEIHQQAARVTEHFLKNGYPLALLAKLVNGENRNDFASRICESVYTLALLAKIVCLKVCPKKQRINIKIKIEKNIKFLIKLLNVIGIRTLQVYIKNPKE